ncbi:8-oxo-dGTP diphosphatase [Poriferisphaera corsica]|uniref:8-oxo-dGTP diphosphatase n=2 Tax=Poriferisphaera corsica TaxID=2528020 RepID=A0A517YPJ6_9BACT|nr:8-oxo-dGTP diphosphatase [Poriferisphaera corsica]
MTVELPYKIATLCYMFDAEGRVLLLHRRRPPNQDLYSPPGGKLEKAVGESPTACALREIREEVGLVLKEDDLHLTGIVSEAGFDDRMHWLMFLYEVKGVVEVERTTFDEGTLDWVKSDEIEGLPIPSTDRDVIWPLFWQHRGGFFMAHINCYKGRTDWSLEQSIVVG